MNDLELSFAADLTDARRLSADELPRLITIDGESGTGKTTQSELIAHRLGYMNVTSGMLFCAGAIALEEADINRGNDREVAAAVQETDIAFALRQGGRPLVSVDGKDVSERLFSQNNKQQAARLSAIPEIANQNESRIKEVAAVGRWVLDRGIRLFPEAELKVWLTASPYVRAVRRCGQLALGDEYVALEQIMAKNAARSRRDYRHHRPPPDAVTIDTTHLDIEEVYAAICSSIQERATPG